MNLFITDEERQFLIEHLVHYHYMRKMNLESIAARNPGKDDSEAYKRTQHGNEIIHDIIKKLEEK